MTENIGLTEKLYFWRNTLIRIIQIDSIYYTFSNLFAMNGGCELYLAWKGSTFFLTYFEAEFEAKRQALKSETSRSRVPLLLVGADGRILTSSEDAFYLGYTEGIFVWDFSNLRTLESFPGLALDLVQVVGQIKDCKDL